MDEEVIQHKVVNSSDASNPLSELTVKENVCSSLDKNDEVTE